MDPPRPETQETVLSGSRDYYLQPAFLHPCAPAPPKALEPCSKVAEQSGQQRRQGFNRPLVLAVSQPVHMMPRFVFMTPLAM
jgi:hypothetical protein